MTTFEFILWRDYYGETLFFSKAEDYRAALSVKQLLAPHTKSEIPLNDFLLFSDKPEEEEKDPEQLAKECQALFGTYRQHQKKV
jgi:hypothetical protein